MKHLGSIVARGFISVILLCVAALSITGVSPIFNFSAPKAFEGPDIFNPYRNFDRSITWKKANFHTHTRIEGPLNECPQWPKEVLCDYDTLGYDIITFSNHNQLTQDPRGSALQYNVYEHGYNLLKYHKLVFGCNEVVPLDHLLPILPSQRQWQLDLLGADADFIQLNHPFRTPWTDKEVMEKLSGYEITELDSGVTTEQEYWDWALSAGHYSFGLANDDLHHPERSDCIAIRCNWLNCTSGKRDDIRGCLRDGCFYSMRVPDYGNGQDWNVKREKNMNLPTIKWIGLKDSTIVIILDRPAKEIIFTGQDHCTLCMESDIAKASYTMKAADSYARITCHFDDGCVIYTNPFARYDKKNATAPFRNPSHSINWPLTVIYNFILSIITVLAIFGTVISIRGIYRK